MTKSKTRSIAMAAIMGAVAFVLQYFSFSVPVLSVFARFDLASVPEIIGGFILGPIGAIEIIVIKLGLILVFKGTSSMFTGELSNFILSCSYVLPAIFYYRKHRTKKGAVIGLLIGSLACVVVAVFSNLFLIFPAYIKLYGLSWDSIIEMTHAVNPLVTSKMTFVLWSVIPFNLVFRVVTSIITFQNLLDIFFAFSTLYQ